ncbi:biopolymer transporter Tol, partial [Agrococcus sp. HG114]|nr:biopolymer transporter Tol [Agrococcus sp. HG114]
MAGAERTEDGRWIVVDGRRWRAEDPALEPEVAASLRSHLGRGRSAVRTAVDDAAR